MMQSIWQRAAVIGLALGWLGGAPDAGTAERPTNVVVILTDNQGAWTLGCYGNRDLRTPNIDRLAMEGMRFTRCYSSNGVCSPTRATYLTGLLPSQHGVHCYLSAGGAQMGPNAYCTIAEFATLPEILHGAGYVCGLVGKWHLGKNTEPQEGFSHWVTMPHGHTATFYGAEVIEAGAVRKEPGYLTEFWTSHAESFIEQHRDRPFFLLLAYNGPYGLGRSLLEPSRNRHAEYYADKLLPSFPRAPIHPWLLNNREYIHNPAAMRRYAAEVSGIDDGVGSVLECLRRHHLDENTLVIYTADQGWTGGQHGIWGMADHTRPLHAFDGTMHIPLLWRHPGRIRAEGRCDLMVSNYDFLPTVLEYLGLQARMPQAPPSPGRSYAAPLGGRSIRWENAVYYEFENTRAVRTDRNKLIRRFPDGPDELYDLAADPQEQTNLFASPEHARMRESLNTKLENFFARYANPQYDLWRGGESKSIVLTRRQKQR